jgi:hypothetical protein
MWNMSEATQLKNMLENIVKKLEVGNFSLPVSFVWDYPDMPSYSFALIIKNTTEENQNV